MNHENFRDDEYRLPDMIVPDGYVQPFVCVVDPLIVRKVSSVEWTPLEREIGFKLTYNSDPEAVADFCGRNNAKNRRRLALERLAKVRKNLDVEVSEFKVSKEEASQGPVGLVVEKEDLEVKGRSVAVIETFDTTAQEAVFTPMSLVPEQKMEICIGSGDEGEVISVVADNQVIQLAEIPQNSVEEIVEIRDQCLGVEPLFEGFDEYHIMNTRSYGSMSGISREPGQADVYYRNVDFLKSELYQYFEGYGDDYLDGFYSDLFCRNRVIVGNVSTINMGLQDRGGDKLSLMKEIFPWVMGKDGVIVRPRWSQDEDRFLWKYRRLITDKMIYSHKLQGENPFEGKGGLSFAMNRLAIRRRVNCGLIFRILVILYERSNQLIRLVGRGFDQEIVLHWRRLFNNLWTVFRYMSTYGIQTAYNRYGSLVFELINELYTLGLHHCQVYSEGEGEGVRLYVDAGIRRGDPNFVYRYDFKYVHFGTDWIEDVIRVIPVELYPIMVLVSKRSYMCVKYAMIKLREKQQDEAYGVNSQGIQDRECCSGVQECEECERYHGEWIERVHPLNSFLEAQPYVYIYNHELVWLYKWIHENRVDVARLIECIQAYRNASNCLVIFHTICFLLYTMGYGHSSWILKYYVKLFPIRMMSGIICDRFTMFS